LRDEKALVDDREHSVDMQDSFKRRDRKHEHALTLQRGRYPEGGGISGHGALEADDCIIYR